MNWHWIGGFNECVWSQSASIGVDSFEISIGRENEWKCDRNLM